MPPRSCERSVFNAFLFADIGTERGGMSLTALSALARLDADPWDEAARLARLPRPLARAALARMIAQLPGTWSPREAPQIAGRLVALLPARAEPEPPIAPRQPWMLPAGLLVTLLVGLLLGTGLMDRLIPTHNPLAAAGQATPGG